MGLNPTSSSTDRIRASLGSYKLTTEEIIDKEKFIRLTDLSNRIIVETREKERLDSIRTAALNDTMTKKLWSGEWKRGLPNDDATIISVLQLEHNFQEGAAKRFANVLKDNYRYCDLAAYYEISRDGVEGNPPFPPQGNIIEPNQSTQNSPSNTGDLVQYPVPLDNGRLASISLPSSLTENDAEFIVDYLTLLLKKLRKSSSNE